MLSHPHEPWPDGVPRNALPLHHGMIQASRVLCLPEPGEAHEARPCAVCGHLAWLLDKTVVYLDMRPWTPLLCCVCIDLPVRLLRRALPCAEVLRRDVPDLRKLGTFN